MRLVKFATLFGMSVFCVAISTSFATEQIGDDVSDFGVFNYPQTMRWLQTKVPEFFLSVEVWQATVGGLATALVTALSGYVWGLRKGLASGFSRGLGSAIDFLKAPINVPDGKRKNTVLVIGLGRVGKSTIITSICEPLRSKKPLMTKEFGIYEAESRIENEEYVLQFTDYEGQDFSQLIRNFVIHQLVPNSPVKYGAINTLLVVVDLFPEQVGSGMGSPENTIPQGRVDFHLNEWNQTAMDAVFGLLTSEHLKYVCLFVNKIDKWAYGNSAGAKQRIEECFDPLITDLKRRTIGGPDFEVIVGSGEQAIGVHSRNGLLPSLYRHSIPMED